MRRRKPQREQQVETPEEPQREQQVETLEEPQREQQVETLDWIFVVCCPARESDLSDQIQSLVFLVRQRPVQCLVECIRIHLRSAGL